MDIEYYRQFEPIFGAWKIVKLLGEGSFGKVFEIEKEEFGAIYRSALKVITIPRNENDIMNAEADGMDAESIATYYRSFVEDFSRESAIMAKLKGHTNIVSFEDTQILEHKDSIGWDIFIRMELLTPLNSYIKSQGGSLTADQSVKLGTDLCRALEVCEKYDIIHRDIKPENIFVSEIGDFELGDFGISRMAEKTTGASTKVGTRDYMAPEVFRADRYDGTVDTYSLSLVLYKLLNGNRLPFLPPAPQGITFTQRNEALEKRISGVPVPPVPGIDPALSQVILKGCSSVPAERYQSAEEFRHALENAVSGVTFGPKAAPAAKPEKPVEIPADDIEDDLDATIGKTMPAEAFVSKTEPAAEKAKPAEPVSRKAKEEVKAEAKRETKEAAKEGSVHVTDSTWKDVFFGKPAAANLVAALLIQLVITIVYPIIMDNFRYGTAALIWCIAEITSVLLLPVGWAVILRVVSVFISQWLGYAMFDYLTREQFRSVMLLTVIWSLILGILFNRLLKKKAAPGYLISGLIFYVLNIFTVLPVITDQTMISLIGSLYRGAPVLIFYLILCLAASYLMMLIERKKK